MATRSKFGTTFLRVVLTVAVLIAISSAYAQQGEDLREAAQNPIADLISVPFQNNTNFDIGRSENTAVGFGAYTVADTSDSSAV